MHICIYKYTVYGLGFRDTYILRYTWAQKSAYAGTSFRRLIYPSIPSDLNTPYIPSDLYTPYIPLKYPQTYIPLIYPLKYPQTYLPLLYPQMPSDLYTPSIPLKYPQTYLPLKYPLQAKGPILLKTCKGPYQGPMKLPLETRPKSNLGKKGSPPKKGIRGLVWAEP